MTRRNLRTALGIVAAALPALLYKPCLDNPFVFDDRVTVLLNPSLVDLSDVRGVLLYNLARPAANISYAIDRAFWGFSSFGFHLTNGILHIIVVGLFYGWCTRAFSDIRTPDPGTKEPGTVEWPAFFAAAAFGLHPLMGATAAYVSARGEILCALGVLSALTLARRAILESSALAGGLAVVFGAVALGSSAAAAGLPIVVWAYDAWVLRDGGWRRRAWRIYLPISTAVGLACAWHVLTVLALDRVPPRSPVDNLLTEAIVVWRYVALLVAPTGQSVVHDVHWVTRLADPVALGALGAAAVALTGAIALRRRAPLLSVGLIWFFVALAPTSSVVPLRDAMAEPRMYVAGAGLLFAAAAALSRPLATSPGVRAAAAAVLAALAILTYSRNAIWSDSLRLWEEAVRRAPRSWQAHAEYAEVLKEAGQCERAMAEYAAAVRLNSHLPAHPPEGWRPSCSP